MNVFLFNYLDSVIASESGLRIQLLYVNFDTVETITADKT